MNTATTSPLRTTLIFGVIFGLGFIPAYDILRFGLPRVTAMLVVWQFYLAIYVLYLLRAAGKSYTQGIGPLFMSLPAIVFAPGLALPLSLMLAGLAWVRSGVCFVKPVLPRIAAEIALCGGGVLLISRLLTPSGVGLSLAVWLFFLIQSLYFLLFEPPAAPVTVAADAFESSRRGAAEILSELEQGRG